MAESVEITIPRPRIRNDIVEHPNYYAIRNHLVHFLAKRSAELSGQSGTGVMNQPKSVHIDLTEPSETEDPEPATAPETLNSPEPAPVLRALEA